MHKLLFVLGPAEIESDILEAGSRPLEYMRTSSYSKKWDSIFQNLKYVFQTNNDVICFSSSGTGAMDAAVSNFCCKSDTALVINGGSFGERWLNICKFYDVKTIEHKVEFGKSVCLNDIADILSNNKVNVLFATLNETSSGALTDIEGIGKILEKYPDTLFIVDCISGLITDKFLQDRWNVDVAISASQKAFALPPGLSFLSCNEKAVKKNMQSDIKSYYFDISEHLKDLKRNQTPYTPAVSLVEQLYVRLEKIKSTGLDNIQTNYKNITEKIRNVLAEFDFKIIAEKPANCVSAVYTDKYDASEIVSIMREKYNIEIAPSGGELKHKLFRIGNYGNITDNDIDLLRNAFKNTISELSKKGC